MVSAIPRTVPSAPTSPVATPGNASVKLTWKQPVSNGGATVDKYLVQRYMPGGSWTTIATPTTLSYPAGGLLNGITYSFRIRARNAAGWGPYSTVVNAVPRTVPGAPVAVQAQPSDGYVGLDWSAPPSGGVPIDNYRVQIATSLAGPWTTYVSVNGTLPLGGIGGLTNGTIYYFRVGAHNAAGWGPYSSAVGAVPRTVPSAPGLTASPVNATQVSWTVQRPANGGAPIDLYRVEMKTGAGGPWVLWQSLGANEPASFIDYVSNLSPGTVYYFRVGAHNAAGWVLTAPRSPRRHRRRCPADRPAAPPTRRRTTRCTSTGTRRATAGHRSSTTTS